MRRLVALATGALLLCAGCHGAPGQKQTAPPDAAHPPAPITPPAVTNSPIPVLPPDATKVPVPAQPPDATKAPALPPDATSEPAWETEYLPELPETEKLLCLVESEQEAREIAALYGITFVRCIEGVATFDTDEDPRAVIRRGKENDWPELSTNDILHAF